MMAASTRRLDEPSEIELLLPWHAAGTLSPRDAHRVEEALATDADLARQYGVIRDEYAETIHLNETLGAPSPRAMHKLFAAIDAEPPREVSQPSRPAGRLTALFANLSPRTLAWSAGVGAIVLLAQAAVIGAVLMRGQDSSFQTAALNVEQVARAPAAAPITRSLTAVPAAVAPRAFVRFTDDAQISDIKVLLDRYQAAIIGSAVDGTFRLQFRTAAAEPGQISAILDRLQREKIVGRVAEIP